MINANMRNYDYYLYGDENEYGQRTLIADENGEPIVQGSIKMAINITTQSVQDHIKYKDSEYMGLTLAPIDDRYVIQYGDERLKVLYINSHGRYKQVFMAGV